MRRADRRLPIGQATNRPDGDALCGHANMAALTEGFEIVRPRGGRGRVWRLSHGFRPLPCDDADGSSAVAEVPLTIDQLLAQGWERSPATRAATTIAVLFRHAGMNALVQCGVAYDVTRYPRTIVNCFELK